MSYELLHESYPPRDLDDLADKMLPLAEQAEQLFDDIYTRSLGDRDTFPGSAIYAQAYPIKSPFGDPSESCDPKEITSFLAAQERHEVLVVRKLAIPTDPGVLLFEKGAGEVHGHGITIEVKQPTTEYQEVRDLFGRSSYRKATSIYSASLNPNGLNSRVGSNEGEIIATGSTYLARKKGDAFSGGYELYYGGEIIEVPHNGPEWGEDGPGHKINRDRLLAHDERVLKDLGLHALIDTYWTEGVKMLRDVARQYETSA